MNSLRAQFKVSGNIAQLEDGFSGIQHSRLMEVRSSKIAIRLQIR